jgi:hypothetical protein
MFQSDPLDIVPSFLETLNRADRSISAKAQTDIDAYKQHVPNGALFHEHWLDISLGSCGDGTRIAM